MKKIVGINVEMPYHSETYTVGEEASGVSGAFYKGGIIKEIKKVIREEIIYLIVAEEGITLELKNSQPGLRIIWGDE